jgi:uncharacterized protein
VRTPVFLFWCRKPLRAGAAFCQNGLTDSISAISPIAWHAAKALLCIALFFTNTPLYAQDLTPSFGTPQKLTLSPLTVQTKAGKKHVFQVEVARSPQEQEIGLMWRLELKPDRGMLFPFAAPRVASFWMRNTYVALDLLFIRNTGEIVNIHANAVPLNETLLTSRGQVSAVLELAAGTTQRLGIAPGDRVVHPALHPGMHTKPHTKPLAKP